MADLQELKDRLDLLSEIERDLGPGKKSGRWILFSCPFPGHAHGDAKPSLAATPDTGTYYCFTCGAKGDVLTWLLEYRGMTWKAIHELGGSGDLPPARPRPAAPGPAEPGKPPAKAWQNSAAAFLERCESALTGPAGAKAFAWLQDARGLSPVTICDFRLGYNPDDTWVDRETWGLDPQPDGKKLWLPKGIVIPYLIGADLWALNVRRPAGDPKYRKIAGSQAALYNADWLRGADLVLLTEGEFDCMVAHQELNDVAGVATLGSATKKLDLATWGVYLLHPLAILAAYDPDKAGQSGSAALAELSARVHLVRVPRLGPGDKDITDYYRAGGDLWQWLKYHLDRLGLLAPLGAPAPDLALPVELPQPALAEP